MNHKYKTGVEPDSIENIKKKAYEAGMNEAWEIIRRVVLSEYEGCFSVDALKEIFGKAVIPFIFANNTAKEAKDRIAAWEKHKEEIHVGDIVESESGNLIVIVTRIVDESFFEGIALNDFSYKIGSAVSLSKRLFYKTDKHFDISQIFALAGVPNGKV